MFPEMSAGPVAEETVFPRSRDTQATGSAQTGFTLTNEFPLHPHTHPLSLELLFNSQTKPLKLLLAPLQSQSHDLRYYEMVTFSVSSLLSCIVYIYSSKMVYL